MRHPRIRSWRPLRMVPRIARSSPGAARRRRQETRRSSPMRARRPGFAPGRAPAPTRTRRRDREGRSRSERRALRRGAPWRSRRRLPVACRRDARVRRGSARGRRGGCACRRRRSSDGRHLSHRAPRGIARVRRSRSLPRQGGAARGRHRGHLRACPESASAERLACSEATVPSQYCTALPAISGIEPVLVAITARPTPRASSSGPFVSPTEPDLRHMTQSAATTADS